MTAGGIAAHVAETGRGEPVVLLHSGAGQARDWRRFTASLPGTYRCLAVDFYGCGGTPAWPGPAAFTIDDQVELVARFARGIGEPVHLCGHSYGGAIALRLAVTQPGLVRTLSLVEPQCYGLLREQGDRLYEAAESGWHSVRAAFERGEPAHGWRQFVDLYSGEGFWDQLRPEIRAHFLAQSPIERWAVLFANPTSIGDVRRLRMPTLVLCGEHTAAAEYRMCEIIAGAAPQATLGLLPAAGHMAPITHPQEVADRVAAHWSNWSPGP